MLARIATGGVVTEVQKVRGGPWGIGRGLGNTIWLTRFDGNRVARFRVGPQVLGTGAELILILLEPRLTEARKSARQRALAGIRTAGEAGD